MYSKIITLLLFLFFNVLVSQEIASINTIKIESNILNQDRDILIYTPKFYNENTLVAYDVVYVFDSQNREFFDFTHSILSFISNTNKKYIVVGITSPYIEKLDYARNSDMLPELKTEASKERYGKDYGNADAFLDYVKNEVVPFVEKNYRTKSTKVAIGHSLSASFILYSMLKMPDLFDDIFAISPNFAFDNNRLANDVKNFDYQKIKKKKFVYLSNANEGITYWKEWKPARDDVYAFIENSNNSDKIKHLIKSFPNETHWSTFAPSLTVGLTEYFEYLDHQTIKLSENTYDITLKVHVPNKKDDVYVTGNQLTLGDWNPDKIRMKPISDFEREIKVRVHAPIELKFTRGSWETEGLVQYNDGYTNIIIDPKEQSKFDFKILEWADQM